MLVIHRNDKTNSGDISCNPLQYTTQPHSILDIDLTIDGFRQSLTKTSPKAIIIGGGGLIDYSDKWNTNINTAIVYGISLKIPVYCYALGINTHLSDKNQKIPVYFSQATKTTIRYHHPEYDLMPCASCLMPIFQKQRDTNTKFAIVQHKAKQIPLQYPKITNDMPPETIIAFIQQAEIIITNTYHAAYWATLLEKPLIIYQPFSTRHTQQLGTFSIMESNQLPTIIPQKKGIIKAAIKANRNFLTTITGEKQ